MALWKSKYRCCCVLLINYILCNKFVVDYKFIYFINYLFMFVCNRRKSKFSDFSLLNSNSRCHSGFDVVQIAYQNSLHNLRSNTVNVTFKEQLYCKPINARISANFFVTDIADTLRRQTFYISFYCGFPFGNLWHWFTQSTLQLMDATFSALHKTPSPTRHLS
jgi:hypothetical protein